MNAGATTGRVESTSCGGSRMAHSLADPNVSEDELVLQVLEQYLSELERGVAVDAESLFVRHPAIAHRLHACLSGLSLLNDSNSPQSVGTGPSLPELAGYTIVREI